MATISTINPSSLRQGGATSSYRLELDNLIRRELKVGDPNDAQQVAGALLERYQTDARARAMEQESKGLPFPQPVSQAPVIKEIVTATTMDMEQALNDVNTDLRELTTNSLLKDVGPELQGWANTIRKLIQEAASSARFALDTQQRDKTFAIRRQLGDYARLARLVGALTPSVNNNYRSLAQSLDEVSAVLLVMMGEGLANVGFAGGRYLLQAPYTELQMKRDSAVYALRNFAGSTQQAYGPNQWPRGVNAYRRLYEVLESHGQGDLRSLLVENELARIMDDLIRRAAQGTPEGLRALGSTAQIELQRFNRLIAIAQRVVTPESPPLSSLLEALQMFVDAFKSAGGARLLRVARPPILFYGLYGNSDEKGADQRLQLLLNQRGMMASQLDCLMSCNCDGDTILCQIILDKVLYDVDRCIDLYAVGDEDWGLPEARAAAYSYVVDAAAQDLPLPRGGGMRYLKCGASAPIKDLLIQIGNTLRPAATNDRFQSVMSNELCMQYTANKNWEQLIRTMAPGCVPPSELFGDDSVLNWLTRVAINRVEGKEITNRVQPICDLPAMNIPADLETSMAAVVFNRGPGGDGV